MRKVAIGQAESDNPVSMTKLMKNRGLLRKVPIIKESIDQESSNQQ